LDNYSTGRNKHPHGYRNYTRSDELHVEKWKNLKIERLKNAFQNGKIERLKDGKTLFKMEKLKD